MHEPAVMQAAAGNLAPLAALPGSKLRALCAAAAGGLIVPLMALLQRGEVDINSKTASMRRVHFAREGVTALHIAAECGHVAAVQQLLKASAALDAEGGPGPHNKWTPLMFAARWGNSEVVAVLLDAGADFQAQLTRAKDHRTALAIAEDPGFEGSGPSEVTQGHLAAQRLLRAVARRRADEW